MSSSAVTKQKCISHEHFSRGMPRPLAHMPCAFHNTASSNYTAPPFLCPVLLRQHALSRLSSASSTSPHTAPPFSTAHGCVGPAPAA